MNGLNQYTSAGGASFGYDANGNLTSDGSSVFLYDIENRLVSASGATTAGLRYDPLGRLYETTGTSGTTRFLHDGDALVAEYNSAGALLRRYVHGAGVDDPLVWYEGAGTSAPRWLHADNQGSVVAVSDASGASIATNRYDDGACPGPRSGGIPQASNSGRFQYTGQAWIAELGLYHYKARLYSPTLGRFLQTDPIGYKDQINLYAYVGNDPGNKTDPSGMCGSLIKEHISAGCSGASILGIMAAQAAQAGATKPQAATAPDGQKAAESHDSSPQSEDVLESRMKGERGRAGSRHGTHNPDKHMKPVPGRPGYGQVKDPQTGKLSGPKPWPNYPRLGPQDSNYTPIEPESTYAPSQESWLGALTAGVIVFIGSVAYFVATTF